MTHGIRTWKRQSSDRSLPVEERIRETTHDYSEPEEAIRTADFITIPRAEYEGEDPRFSKRYDRVYAERLARALRERFGFEGAVRQSRSGRSHVIERERPSQGLAYDFGLRRAPRPAFNGR